MDTIAAFNYHPLTKITVKERLLFGLSFSQTGWVGLGIWLSFKMAEFVPKLPFSLIMGYVHYLVPFIICLFFGFITHKTGQTFIQYFISLVAYKRRKKYILHHKIT